MDEEIIIEEVGGVMSDGEIRALINEAIRPKNWNDWEWNNGKQVDIFPEWVDQMHHIVCEYRNVGWKVLWWNHAGRQYLEFECPWRDK